MANQMSVVEAAERLGVHPQRVHQRIRSGSLPAVKVGRQWVIQASDIQRLTASKASAGRPLSVRSAHNLLACAEGHKDLVAAMSSSERSRARSRLRILLSLSGGEENIAPLRRALTNRAERVSLAAAPRDLPHLREDPRLHLSGLSSPMSGIAASDVVEAYVMSRDAEKVRQDHLLVHAPIADSNVILHIVVEGESRLSAAQLAASPLSNAADLSDQAGPREGAAAYQLLLQAVAAAR